MATELSMDGDVMVLRMHEPRGNALGLATLSTLNRMLNDVIAADPAVLVWTGAGKVFGGGLDVVQASTFDRAALVSFVDAFENFFMRLLAFEVPMVAAVNGHAFAGGAVTLLACDVRVAQRGPLAIALNEVDLGMPFPSTALQVARFGIPPQHHTEAIALGARYDVDRAHAAGLVHHVDDDALARAQTIAHHIASKSKSAVRTVRATLRAPFVAAAHQHAAVSRAAFVDAWLAPATHARIVQLAAQLTQR